MPLQNGYYLNGPSGSLPDEELRSEELLPYDVTISRKPDVCKFQNQSEVPNKVSHLLHGHGFQHQKFILL